MLEADFIQFHTSSLERTLIILSTYFYNSQIQVSCANYSFRTHFPSLFQVASYLECQNHQFQHFQHTSLKKSARICLKKFCNSLPEFRRQILITGFNHDFLLIFFQSLELKCIEKFLINFGDLKGKLLPIIGKSIATLNFTSNYWKNSLQSLKSTSKGFSCIST